MAWRRPRSSRSKNSWIISMVAVNPTPSNTAELACESACTPQRYGDLCVYATGARDSRAWRRDVVPAVPSPTAGSRSGTFASWSSLGAWCASQGLLPGAAASRRRTSRSIHSMPTRSACVGE
jgi:hypothetical protein